MYSLDYTIYLLNSSALLLSIVLFIIYSRNNFTKGVVYKLISILFFLFSFRLFLANTDLIISFPNLLLVDELNDRIIYPVLFLVLVLSLHPRQLRIYDLMHLVLPILFIIHFWDIYTESASFKISLIQQMNQLGKDLIWEKGIFNSKYLIFGLQYVIAPSYLVLMGVLFFR